MTQYNSLDVKLSDSLMNYNEEKNGTGVTLDLSSNVIGDSNDETNYSHKLLSTDRQVSRFSKLFVDKSSTNIKLRRLR